MAQGTPPVDVMQKLLGQWGRYQFWLCVLLFLSKFPIAWHQMAIIFLAPKASFTCDGVKDKCPCENPVFDKSIFTRSIIMEWKLICGRKWLAGLVQMLFQLGTLLGSIGFGMLSDRFGRKPPFVVAIILQVTAGIAAAYASSFWLFNLFRFIVGLSVGGTMVIGFVHMCEFIGTAYRPTVSVLYQAPFNLGHVSLPLLGYIFRDYSDFQLSISLPIAILLCYICLLAETPRWLIAMRKTDAAIKVTEAVAKMNKLPTDTIRSELTAYQAEIEKNDLKKGTLFDLFKTPNLRRNILAMAYNWFACSYCFYGVSQYISRLTGNIFINVLASATITLIGTLLCVPLIKVMKRKTVLVLFQGICAVCMFILAFIPPGTAAVVCACIGDVAAFVVFIMVYLYSGELFPTVVRNAAIGFSSMCARIGSMIAPFVIECEDIAMWLPAFLFGLVPAIAVFAGMLLPETKGCDLMTTLAEGEAFGQKTKTGSSAPGNVQIK